MFTLAYHGLSLRPGLMSLQNGTVSIQKDEPIDFMPILADWAHGKNLPSFKSVFVGIAVAANIVVNYFVRSQGHICT
jgi:hypothetical protein